jgi:hypothetical protein
MSKQTPYHDGERVILDKLCRMYDVDKNDPMFWLFWYVDEIHEVECNKCLIDKCGSVNYKNLPRLQIRNMDDFFTRLVSGIDLENLLLRINDCESQEIRHFMLKVKFIRQAYLAYEMQIVS